MDPIQQRLKRARTEIERVMKNHDVAGYVTLFAAAPKSEGHDWGEVFWNIWPSYSILKGDFPHIALKSKLADYGGNQTKQLRHQEATAGMVHHLATSMGQHALMFLELDKLLEAKLGAEHSEPEFIPDPSKHNPGTH